MASWAMFFTDAIVPTFIMDAFCYALQFARFRCSQGYRRILKKVEGYSVGDELRPVAKSVTGTKGEGRNPRAERRLKPEARSGVIF
jgi:hypothetical protein